MKLDWRSAIRLVIGFWTASCTYSPRRSDRLFPCWHEAAAGECGGKAFCERKFRNWGANPGSFAANLNQTTKRSWQQCSSKQAVTGSMSGKTSSVLLYRWWILNCSSSLGRDMALQTDWWNVHKGKVRKSIPSMDDNFKFHNVWVWNTLHMAGQFKSEAIMSVWLNPLMGGNTTHMYSIDKWALLNDNSASSKWHIPLFT